MLNPLAEHHSQSELAMINNPTREIWLVETEAGDLREWVTAMSALSGLSQIGNRTPRKHEMFICNGLCRLFSQNMGWDPIRAFCGLHLNESWTLCACCSVLTPKSLICKHRLVKGVLSWKFLGGSIGLRVRLVEWMIHIHLAVSDVQTDTQIHWFISVFICFSIHRSVCAAVSTARIFLQIVFLEQI